MIPQEPIVTIPSPGSYIALQQGCSCPVHDNRMGEGFYHEGKLSHWIKKFCPLHDTKPIEESMDGD